LQAKACDLNDVKLKQDLEKTRHL